jgi:adenylyltransferase/sulfurtransferase
MSNFEIHSRSRLAGYDPGKLAAARVTIVGLGALGQNLLQTLALSGVGRFLLIDYDSFEDHNATRSPFFPTAAEASLLGLHKAPVVAHRALAASTASSPQVLYLDDIAQRGGDRVIRWADIVVAAVDSVSARAWLAERARLHGKPLVEGGFFGPEFNFSAFSAAAGAGCYRCFNPAKVSSASCTQYAMHAERQNIVPAIQATAAVLAGLMAEQVINIIHDTESSYGTRYYGNTRRPAMHSALLRPDPQCPGEHDPLPVRTLARETPDLRTVADLLAAVREHVKQGWIAPAEPIVLTASCTACTAKCIARTAESSWMINPRCTECGGPWPRSETAAPGMISVLDLETELDEQTRQVELAELGLGPGGCVLVDPGDEPAYLLEMPGRPTFSSAEELTGRVSEPLPASLCPPGPTARRRAGPGPGRWRGHGG